MSFLTLLVCGSSTLSKGGTSNLTGYGFTRSAVGRVLSWNENILDDSCISSARYTIKPTSVILFEGRQSSQLKLGDLVGGPGDPGDDLVDLGVVGVPGGLFLRAGRRPLLRVCLRTPAPSGSPGS